MIVVDSPEEVAKFLHLQSLSIEELKIQCDDNDIINNQTSKSFLIDLIMGEAQKENTSQGLRPQGIPLKSKNKNGKLIPKATETYKKWRKLIFATNGNLKYFDFVNKDGEKYSVRVWFIKCSIATAQYLLKNDWYSKYPSQKNLINEILKNSENFEYNIIQKNAGNGNNFLMLHCKPKKD